MESSRELAEPEAEAEEAPPAPAAPVVSPSKQLKKGLGGGAVARSE